MERKGARTRKVKEAFDSVAEFYDRFMEETGHAEVQRRIARFIAGNRVGKVLDVATGTGIMLEAFEKGVGVDISLPMLRRAKQKQPNKEFIVANAHTLPFRDKIFDASISCLTFPWLDDLEKALREMLRVTKKAYIVEEEGTPTRKRVDVPDHMKPFFERIEKLEREVNIEKLARKSGFACRRVFEENIDEGHRFIVYEVR